jgi:hypothetical protein
VFTLATLSPYPLPFSPSFPHPHPHVTFWSSSSSDDADIESVSEDSSESESRTWIGRGAGGDFLLDDRRSRLSLGGVSSPREAVTFGAVEKVGYAVLEQ